MSCPSRRARHSSAAEQVGEVAFDPLRLPPVQTGQQVHHGVDGRTQHPPGQRDTEDPEILHGRQREQDRQWSEQQQRHAGDAQRSSQLRPDQTADQLTADLGLLGHFDSATHRRRHRPAVRQHHPDAARRAVRHRPITGRPIVRSPGHHRTATGPQRPGRRPASKRCLRLCRCRRLTGRSAITGCPLTRMR